MILKQPALGALGALDIATVKQIVAGIDGRCPVSATIGDLPMQPDPVFNAVKAMAETGVDYIKIGFFPGDDWQGPVKKLSALTQQNHALIAVLFADTQPDFAIMSLLERCRFYRRYAGYHGQKERFINSVDGKNGDCAICQPG